MRSTRHPQLLALLAAALLGACGADGTGEAAPGASAAAEGAPAAQSSAPAARGDFEGVIRALSHDEGERHDVVIYVKDSRWRMEMEMDGERGAIIRGADGRTLSVMESQRQYLYMPQLDGEDEAMQYAATGENETVAGHRCQYYRITDPNGVQDGDQVCVTTELGFVGFGAGGPFGVQEERAIRGQFRDGFLILKSRDAEGALEWEVTGIERTSVSDAQFAPPAGYTELQMPGMGAPPRR